MNNLNPKLTPDLQASEKFQPKQETLPSINQLMQQAQVSTTDVSNSVQTWVVDVPDDEYVNLLEAE